jgi:formylglycine-generating enzyme required for sulfatase activity
VTVRTSNTSVALVLACVGMLGPLCGGGVLADDDAGGAPTEQESARRALEAKALVSRWLSSQGVERVSLRREIERRGAPLIHPLRAHARAHAADPVAVRAATRLALHLEQAFHRCHIPPGMVYIPAGSLEVPRTRGPPGPSGRRVQVRAFYMDHTEVTVGAWRAWVRAYADGQLEGLPRQPPVKPRPEWADDEPMRNVHWREATAFATVFRKGRLPEAAEFERAVRGSGVMTWPWGTLDVRGRANLRGFGHGSIEPVGSYPRGSSPFGVLDLVGNVAEWSATTRRGGSSPLSVRPYAFGGSFQSRLDAGLVWRRPPRGGGVDDQLARRASIGLRVVKDVPALPEDAKDE